MPYFFKGSSIWSGSHISSLTLLQTFLLEFRQTSFGTSSHWSTRTVSQSSSISPSMSSSPPPSESADCWSLHSVYSNRDSRILTLMLFLMLILMLFFTFQTTWPMFLSKKLTEIYLLGTILWFHCIKTHEQAKNRLFCPLYFPSNRLLSPNFSRDTNCVPIRRN